MLGPFQKLLEAVPACCAAAGLWCQRWHAGLGAPLPPSLPMAQSLPVATWRSWLLVHTVASQKKGRKGFHCVRFKLCRFILPQRVNWMCILNSCIITFNADWPECRICCLWNVVLLWARCPRSQQCGLAGAGPSTGVSFCVFLHRAIFQKLLCTSAEELLACTRGINSRLYGFPENCHLSCFSVWRSLQVASGWYPQTGGWKDKQCASSLTLSYPFPFQHPPW